jgi:hypothetical protein
MQSPRATITAWKNDPLRTITWLTATEVIPEMMAYLWNASLGPEYINYNMEGRSEGNRLNSTYVAIPGMKPWQGVEFPNYQETSGLRLLARVTLDHLIGRSSNTYATDAWDVLNSAWKTNFEPQLPSPFSMVLAMQNVTTPQGMFGEGFRPKSRGFDESRPDENTLEKMLHAAMPSVADYWIQFKTAAHAHQGGDIESAVAGTKAVAKRVAGRTFGVRDVWHLGADKEAPQSGRIQEQLYKKKDVIKKFLDYATREREHKGGIRQKDRSREGGDKAREFLDPGLALPKGDGYADNPGLPQVKPTNPLFLVAEALLKDTFQKDAPSKGGSGYLSTIGQYSKLTQALDRMNHISDEYVGRWLEQQKDNKVFNAYLDQGHVDKTNFHEVKSYYADQRTKIGKEMLNYITAVEQKMDQLPIVRQTLGPDKHFELEMVDPWKPGLTIPDSMK